MSGSDDVERPALTAALWWLGTSQCAPQWLLRTWQPPVSQQEPLPNNLLIESLWNMLNFLQPTNFSPWSWATCACGRGYDFFYLWVGLGYSATRLTYALVTFSMAPAMIRTGSSHTAVGRANHSATDSCYVSDERNERGREFQVVGRAQSSHNI